MRRIALRTALGRTIAASAACAALLFGGLTLQMAQGQDPALGAGDSPDKGGGTASTTATTTPAPAVEQESDDGSVVAVQQQAPAPAPVQTSTS